MCLNCVYIQILFHDAAACNNAHPAIHTLLTSKLYFQTGLGVGFYTLVTSNTFDFRRNTRKRLVVLPINLLNKSSRYHRSSTRNNLKEKFSLEHAVKIIYFVLISLIISLVFYHYII